MTDSPDKADTAVLSPAEMAEIEKRRMEPRGIGAEFEPSRECQCDTCVDIDRLLKHARALAQRVAELEAELEEMKKLVEYYNP